MRILPVLFTAALFAISLGAAPINIDFTPIPTGCASTVVGPGFTISGSSDICAGPYIGVNGLGILGGGLDSGIDPGESMTFDFGSLVSFASIVIWDVDPVGNVAFGFEAFNGITSLGTFAIPTLAVNPTTVDLTALAGQSFSSFTINLTAAPPIGLQIQGLSFEPAPTAEVPEPATLLITGAGLTLLASLRRRQA